MVAVAVTADPSAVIRDIVSTDVAVTGLNRSPPHRLRKATAATRTPWRRETPAKSLGAGTKRDRERVQDDREPF